MCNKTCSQCSEFSPANEHRGSFCSHPMNQEADGPKLAVVLATDKACGYFDFLKHPKKQHTASRL
jgi:hypothetical protein